MAFSAKPASCTRRAVLVSGTVAVAGAAAGGLALQPPRTARGAEPDARALELLLLVEYTEVAFYDRALDAGRLTGEVRDYVETVAAQEREHLEYLKRLVGSDAPPAPDFDFGVAVSDRDAFIRRAAELEDLAVAAYNGQGTNVGRDTLRAAASVASVEARHAAWIRSIAGKPPAPDAVDQPQSADAVLATLEQFGMPR